MFPQEYVERQDWVHDSARGLVGHTPRKNVCGEVGIRRGEDTGNWSAKLRKTGWCLRLRREGTRVELHN